MKEILKEIYDFSLWLGLDLDVEEEHVERERERVTIAPRMCGGSNN